MNAISNPCWDLSSLMLVIGAQYLYQPLTYWFVHHINVSHKAIYTFNIYHIEWKTTEQILIMHQCRRDFAWLHFNIREISYMLSLIGATPYRLYHSLAYWVVEWKHRNICVVSIICDRMCVGSWNLSSWERGARLSHKVTVAADSLAEQ